MARRSIPTADTAPEPEDHDAHHDEGPRRRGLDDRPQRLTRTRNPRITMSTTTHVRAGQGSMIDPNG
jgi:hypothetical protein